LRSRAKIIAKIFSIFPALTSHPLKFCILKHLSEKGISNPAEKWFPEILEGLIQQKNGWHFVPKLRLETHGTTGSARERDH
jgi:hypothetical protein